MRAFLILFSSAGIAALLICPQNSYAKVGHCKNEAALVTQIQSQTLNCRNEAQIVDPLQDSSFTYEIETHLMQISSELGFLCPESSKGNQTLAQGERLLKQQTQALKNKGDLNKRTAESAQALHRTASAAEIHMKSADKSSQAITRKNVPELKRYSSQLYTLNATSCSNLAQNINRLEKQLQTLAHSTADDLRVVAELQQKARDIAGVSISITGDRPAEHGTRDSPQYRNSANSTYSTDAQSNNSPTSANQSKSINANTNSTTGGSNTTNSNSNGDPYHNRDPRNISAADYDINELRAGETIDEMLDRLESAPKTHQVNGNLNTANTNSNGADYNAYSANSFSNKNSKAYKENLGVDNLDTQAATYKSSATPTDYYTGDDKAQHREPAQNFNSTIDQSKVAPLDKEQEEAKQALQKIYQTPITLSK